MKIYHVDFWIVVELDENGQLCDGMNDEVAISDNIDGEFDLGALDLASAYLMASEYLDESVGTGMYEITGVKQRDDIDLVNWPGGDECQCPDCRTDRAAEEDKISFACKKCGYEIKIINDFDKIYCPKCETLILRDRIIGSGSNYIMLDLGEDKE